MSGIRNRIIWIKIRRQLQWFGLLCKTATSTITSWLWMQIGFIVLYRELGLRIQAQTKTMIIVLIFGLAIFNYYIHKKEMNK